MFPSDRLLIQVVPRLKPARCGVSDQAIMLAQELKAAFGIDTAFVVLNSNEACSLPYSIIYRPPAQLLETCLSLVEGRPGAILVHLSGYGYSADGAPTLLADALANVRTDGRFRIAVYFHELFATGMPWRSAFWHSRRQRNAVRRIAEGCDLLVTSSRYHADWLEREPMRQSAAPIQLLPVFSAVGETAAPTPVPQREPAIAVFGLAGTRRNAYKKMASQAGMLHDLGIKEILDIGPEFDAPRELNGIPVRRAGTLAAPELADLLSHSIFGFAPHDPPSLAKSSVSAAYCAHGTIPVLASTFPGEIDGLADGVNILSPRTAKAARESGLERCSGAAWRWYSEHNVRTHASRYAAWLMRAE
jgi:hypothetical protein